jgi:cytosine/adenosine deaminase-related metal-dependent hydrolase
VKEVIHRAGWVMVDPETWIENGAVAVLDGRIVSVGQSGMKSGATDHGPGVIMPALGNAHTHLSLSPLKDRVDTGDGFISWTRNLIRLRESVSQAETESACTAAAATMKESGVGLAAEVGPLQPGTRAMDQNHIMGLVFLECLGTGPDYPPLPDHRQDLFFSWAGHAPHTTSPELLRAIKAAANRLGKPFSIHLAESEAEVTFLGTGRGPWAELMENRGHDYSTWGPWGERPVERACRLGLLDSRTIAVHLLETTPDELEILARTGTRVCLCPRSNLALHGRLPDIEGFLVKGLLPAIGTDSLASVPSLDLFHEMAFIASHYPRMRPETILSLATVNAAHVLGFQQVGSLKPGMSAQMIYVDLGATTKAGAAERLVSETDLPVNWL